MSSTILKDPVVNKVISIHSFKIMETNLSRLTFIPIFLIILNLLFVHCSVIHLDIGQSFVNSQTVFLIIKS